MSAPHDVAILGGGPAGTAAALTLLKRDGVRVAVVEASGYDAPRPGESLTPGVRSLLEYLGVWDAFRASHPLDAFGSLAAWGHAETGALDFLFTLHGPGWGLDRVGFDRMLAEAASARGADVRTRTRFTGVEREADGTWTVGLDTGTPLRARFLLDATGRRGRLARRLGAVREVYDRLVGVGGVVPLGGRAVESAVLVEACETGWWYSAPVPGDGLAVVFMSDADLVHALGTADAAAWREQLARTTHTRERAGDAALPGTPTAFAAHTSRLRTVGGDGWLAVGDAAASHDPLSSTGIPHALGTGVHGAIAAADALFADGAMRPRYAEGLDADFGQYVRTHWLTYQKETRWPDAPFWARRRTAVALPAEATVASADPAEAAAPIHLSARRSRDLLARCHPGRPLHEAVRAFADAHPDVPHERAILGLQELVDAGHVRLTDAGAPTPLIPG